MRGVSAEMERINQKHGRETIRLGVVKPQGKWSTIFGSAAKSSELYNWMWF